MSHLPFSRKIPSSADKQLALSCVERLALSSVEGLRPLLAVAAFLLALSPVLGSAQAPSAATGLTTHIANLASLDFQTRMNAARMIRRVAATEAVPALTAAVTKHQDEFVRYRALIVLSSFSDRGTGDLVRGLLRDRNDRLREVAYKWLEAHPDPALTSTLLAALQTERAEFVRPALVGALAALGTNTQVQRALIAETTRGLDFFRSAVIDAVGRHRGTYAVDAVAGVAALEGPLQDDAVLALGRMGGARATAALAALKNAPPQLMLTIHAAQCLAGGPCDAPIKVLVDAAVAPGASAAMVRTAVGALADVVSDGNRAATAALVGLADRGGNVRSQGALGFAAAAVRNPDHVIAWLDAAPENVRASAIDLLKEGFEDLEEDFGEEQFFAAARASYWKAAEGSTSRTMAAMLIEKLEF